MEGIEYMTNTTKPIKPIKGSESHTLGKNVKIITDIKTVDDFNAYNLVRGEKEWHIPVNGLNTITKNTSHTINALYVVIYAIVNIYD